ncbi:hypothetical protein TEQG_00422 [Trichophyton equinum CBS 127.97]|uniref:Uncharacterized protein n=1 Tax=Trichophyton equinum (strain ATCC MYA-4606 / CBS 127.97) TaxID=559882 RepID=F2PHK2_TRIEC|nr:hypothetical protein TEQG_00422 [Trichophyton equinum CBS 127.97]
MESRWLAVETPSINWTRQAGTTFNNNSRPPETTNNDFLSSWDEGTVSTPLTSKFASAYGVREATEFPREDKIAEPTNGHQVSLRKALNRFIRPKCQAVSMHSFKLIRSLAVELANQPQLAKLELTPGTLTFGSRPRV